jgi:hypothetical protein
MLQLIKILLIDRNSLNIGSSAFGGFKNEGEIYAKIWQSAIIFWILFLV